MLRPFRLLLSTRLHWVNQPHLRQQTRSFNLGTSGYASAMDGTRLHFRANGSRGPAILCMPGALGEASCFTCEFTILALHHYVARVEPGRLVVADLR